MSRIKFGNLNRAEKELTQLKYRDLKIACIVRGMLFEDVVEGSYPTLSSWFLKHYEAKQDRSLLERFDNWMEEQLLKKPGRTKDDPLVQFRLSTVVDEEENTRLRTKSLKKAAVKKEKKPKRERDGDFNIFKGTKKALTYELAAQGVNIDEAVEKVKEKFPEAVDKSIRIWYKRALKDKKK